ATGGPVAEGNVGAGTGTGAFGFKAGIGTSSRVVETTGSQATLGVLVQTNFEGRLIIDGVSMAELQETEQPRARKGSSIMIILATDLPLSGRLLGRLARRAVFGLARTGSFGNHGSGDYVIAFSTSYRNPGVQRPIREALAREEAAINAAFRAAAGITEEAILNSLFKAERMVGRDGHTLEALPIGKVMEILKRNGRY
ncbi:MAG TPA: P1 family peptidase, partial [Spirochaetia bacterium]|nr:P1 family peptidase [Spirochaetia bacterium]